ncbi:PTS sugar transporter subunit IIA [Dermabacter hominis 1368]|uniref:PTS sugar transporter subunit IIA n=1 Tax=Dermabacter hominis 1368 TaxID=1450519 RepID=A0ABR4SIX4_9MICO|nr:PTS sugar transporter subunit IIA [Dermabacter hominis 1368]
MQRDLIKRDLVQFDWDVADQAEFFTRMVDKLERLGYVKDSFLPAIVAREHAYPTALPTEPEAIAIPHSDAEHILTPFIASTRLASAIAWHDMGDSSVTHQVKLVFMLGFTRADGHIEVLQILLQNFQNPSFTEALNAAKTEDEFFLAAQSLQGLED